MLGLNLTMVDIHHHLLAGFDDGASDPETSVAMARIAAADGITHAVCTPHANDRYPYDPERVRDKITELQGLLTQEGIQLQLGRGSDFHLTYDNIQLALREPERFSINGRGYLLVELPDYGLPPGLSETFYELQLAGMTPILTHPERNPTLQAERYRMRDWLRGGLLVQVTAGSLLGHMGKSAKKMSHDLLKNRWVHFLATDAHNITSRPPKMREAYTTVADTYGPEYAHLLCVSNPLAAFQGAPLPQQPEPLDLYENLDPKHWWQRLFPAL